MPYDRKKEKHTHTHTPSWIHQNFFNKTSPAPSFEAIFFSFVAFEYLFFFMAIMCLWQVKVKRLTVRMFCIMRIECRAVLLLVQTVYTFCNSNGERNSWFNCLFWMRINLKRRHVQGKKKKRKRNDAKWPSKDEKNKTKQNYLRNVIQFECIRVLCNVSKLLSFKWCTAE